MGAASATSGCFGTSCTLDTNSVLTSSGSLVVQSTSSTAGIGVLRVENYAGTDILKLTQAGNLSVSLGSVTGNAFFGDGSSLTGIPSTGSIVGIYTLKAGDAMTGPLLLSAATMTVTGANVNGRGLDVTYGVLVGSITASSATITGAQLGGSLCVGNQPCVLDANSVETSSGSLVVQSTSSTAGHDVVVVKNNAGTELFRIQQDGIMTLGVASPNASSQFETSGAIAAGTNIAIGDGYAIRLSGMGSTVNTIGTGGGNRISFNVNTGEKIRFASDGGLAPYSRTKAQLEALTPDASLEIFACSNCDNTVRLVISTGTTVSQFDSIPAGTAWH